jgi:hypothetical protein
VDSTGKSHSYQGYEDRILKILDRSSKVASFSTSDIPKIRYRYKKEAKSRTYHPDIVAFLKDGRKLLIEVKSTYTLVHAKTFALNKRKFEVASKLSKQHGFEFWLAVVDKKVSWHWNGLH